MRLTPSQIQTEYEWTQSRAESTVVHINQIRSDLGEIFDVDVDPVTEESLRQEIDSVFENGDLAVNVAGLIHLLRNLDVPNDYPGFIVDEILGRELAGMIAGQQPLRTLGEATFHYADIHIHGEDDDPAGLDDLDAALVAGFQERLPGWPWVEAESPFRPDQYPGENRP